MTPFRRISACLAFLLAVNAPVGQVFAAALSPIEREALAKKVPEIARVDASAAFVNQTLNGARSGYLVVFKPGSKAHPEYEASASSVDISAPAGSRPVHANIGAAKRDLLQSVGLSPAQADDRYSELPITYIEVSSADELNRLLSVADIESIHENRIKRTQTANSLPLIKWPSITAFGNLGQGTSVAVLDTGVVYTDPAFGPCTAPGLPAATCRVVFARDFTLEDDGLLDRNDGHGTNVAAIVAAVAPAAKILALDVFNGSQAEDADILAAMNWVIERQRTEPNTYNIAAMNLSLGDDQPTAQQVTTGAYKVAVDLALSYRIATIVAAGNNSSPTGLSAPANTLGAISVGAVYSSGDFPADACYADGGKVDRVVCSSNRAPYLTILAPGKAVVAAGYSHSGTSQATPHVAGAYAILRAAFPLENHDALIARMTSNGVMIADTRFMTTISFPRLNLWGAMGSCSYAFPAAISLLGGAVTKNLMVTTNRDYCPFGVATPPPASWLHNLSVTQDAMDWKRWTISYTVDCNSAAAPCNGSGTARATAINLSTAAASVPSTISVSQSGTLGDQQITRSAVSLDFGDYEKSGIPSAALSVAIGNAGGANPLTLSSISVLQADKSPCPDFAKTDSCSGQDIAPGATCSIAVTFTPTQANPRACKLRILSNDSANAVVDIALRGNGQTVSGGRLDSLFGTAGTVASNDRLFDLFAVPDPEASILAGGAALVSGVPDGKILVAKYKGDGTAYSPFVNSGRATLDIALPRTSEARFVRRDSMGRTLVFGTSTTGSDKKTFIARLTANGDLDTSPGFGTNGIVPPSAFGTAIVGLQDDHLQHAAIGADDRLYLKINCRIVRLSAAGAIELAYGQGGYASLHDCVDMAPFVVMADGSVLYATSSVDVSTGHQGIGVSKLTPAGMPDMTFGKDGTANGRAVSGIRKGYASDLAVFQDGKILAIGPLWKNQFIDPGRFSAHAVRFTPDGQEDVTFGAGGFVELAPDSAPAYPGALRVISDGQFAVLRTRPPSGVGNADPGSFDVRVWKADGQPDGSFSGFLADGITRDIPGRANSALGDGVAMTLTPDGGILVTYANPGTGANGLVKFKGPQLSGSSAAGVGGRIVGSQSDGVQLTVQFTNGTSSPVTAFMSVVSSSSEFQVVGNTCSFPIPPAPAIGSTCDITYTVTRTITGPRAATLTVTTPQGNFLLSLLVTVVAQTSFPLSVSRGGSGAGQVISSPPGIDCGGTCQLNVVSNGVVNDQNVTLSALPDPGSVFSGWSGDCTGTGTCTVTVSSTRNVTANFSILPGYVPVNDSFASRRVLTGSLVQDHVSNIGASKELSESNHAGNTGGKSLWWTWTAPVTGRVTIDTKGSTFDTLLAVYTGSTVASLALIGQNDDSAFTASAVTYEAVRGQTYQIAVDGYNSTSGVVALNIHQPIYAYIPSQTLNVVKVIDTVTNSLTASIPAGAGGTGVAISPIGNRAFISNASSNDVSVIDTSSNTVVATIPVGVSPRGVAINPLGTRVYVSNLTSGTIYVIDTTALGYPVIANVPMSAAPGAAPYGIVFNPAGTRAYIAIAAENAVAVMDTANNSIIGRFNVGADPTALVINADGTRLYVTNQDDNTVSVIDLTVGHAEIARIPVGIKPFGIAINPAGTRVYVANPFSDTVSVIDATNNIVKQHVAIGADTYPTGVSVTPDGLSVYVVSYGRNAVVGSISVIDTSTDTLVPSKTFSGQTTVNGLGAFIFSGGIPVAQAPSSDMFAARRPLSGAYTFDIENNSAAGMNEPGEPSHGIGATGKSLWWTWTAPSTGRVTIDTFGSSFDTLLAVYSGSTLGSLGLISQNNDGPGLGNASAVSFDAVKGQNYQIAVDGNNGASGRVTLNIWQPRFAYIPSQNTNQVTVLDTVTNTLRGNIGVGSLPEGVAVNATGTRAYVTNYSSNNVSVIDTASNSVVATVAVGSNPIGVAVNPAGTRVYVANYGGSDVSVIDAATNTVVATMLVGTSPTGIAFNPLGTRVYVANRLSGNVSVIDATNNLVIETVNAGTQPYALAVNASGSKVYVTNAGSNSVSVIDAASNAVQTTVTVGATPYGIAVDPTGTRVYVSNSAGQTVSVIDASVNTVIATVNVGMYPSAIQVTPDGTHVYVANVNSDSLSVIDTVTNIVVATLPGFNSPTPFGLFTFGGGTAIPVAPVNDVFSGVQTVSGSFVTVKGNNYQATKDAGEPNHAGNAGGKSVWWSWTAPYTGRVTIDTFGSNFDTLLGVYTGSAVDSLVPIANNDDASAGGSTSSVNFAATAGQTYRIAVDGKGGASGSIVLNVWQPINAYIASHSASVIFVLDTVTNTLAPSITTGYSNHEGIVVNSSGNRVYATNYLNNSIVAVDTTTNMATTIPVGTQPEGIAVNPTGTRVYVANTGSGNVSVIDTAGNAVIATIPVGPLPVALAVNPGGTLAYASVSGNGTVVAIDTASNTVVNSIPVGSDTRGIALNASGTRLYTANLGGNSVSVIDTGSNMLVATVTVGIQPYAIAVNPVGSRVYVTNIGSNTVSVIDATNNTVIQALTVGTYPIGVSFTPDGARAYVTNYLSNTISVIDTITYAVTTQSNIVAPVGFGSFIYGGGPSASIPGPTGVPTAVAGNAQATITFAAPASNGGSPITSYSATSAPGSITSTCNAPCTTITVTGLTNGTAYTFTVRAINGIGSGPASSPSNSVTPLGAQAITFGAVPSVTVGNSGMLSATGGASGNPVIFTSTTTSVCTLSGTNGSGVTGVTAGACVVAANQAGNATYSAAPQVTQSITVGKGTQATLIASATATTLAFGATTTLSTSGGSGTGAVTFASNNANCTISGVTLTAAVVGNCTVTATKATDANYLVATATVGITINAVVPDPPTGVTASAGNQQASIAFAAPTFTGGSAILDYAATCGGLSSTGPNTPIIVMGLMNNVMYTCTVRARNAIGLSAASLPASVTPTGNAEPTNTTVTSNLNPALTGANVTFTATVTSTAGSVSGTVSFKADGATMAGCGAVPLAAGNAQCITSFATTGTRVITAEYSGSGSKSPSSGTLAGGQVITATTFSVTPTAGSNGSISPATVQTVASGATTTFSVTASMGYTASVSGTCGGTLTGATPNYSFTTNPVTANCTVIASFTNTATVPGAPVIGAATPGNGQATIGFTPPTSDGGSAITGYTVTCNPGSFTATGGMSPLTVTGLTNGTPYTCSVTATNSVGSSTPSATVSVTPQLILVVTAVQSRKTHGTVGVFDLPVSRLVPITGAVSVEPRFSPAGHQIVFQFSVPITSVGAATVVDASVTPIGTAYAAAIGNDVVVTLIGVRDNQRATITVTGINGSGIASVSLGFLVGDVNSSHAVNSSDIGSIKARLGQTTSSGNFRFDINASGAISPADLTAAKARSGQVLP